MDAPTTPKAETIKPDSAQAWRRLALQFDGHRMQAIGHLQCLMKNPQAHRADVELFLSAPPPSGEAVLAERILDLSGMRPKGPAPDAISIEKALEALDAMDDYARMNVGVDAIGPRGVLERFIAQQRNLVTND